MVNDRLRVLDNGVEPSTGGGDVGDGGGGGGGGVFVDNTCGKCESPALGYVQRLTYFLDYKNTF